MTQGISFKGFSFPNVFLCVAFLIIERNMKVRLNREAISLGMVTGQLYKVLIEEQGFEAAL